MAMQKAMDRGSSILITGGAGFIGSHLLERLLEEHDVTVLDNFSSGKRENLALCREKEAFRLIEADLLAPDPDCLRDALAGKDMVFHLAANPDVRLGAIDPEIHLKQNIIATHNLLEAMRAAGVKKIAFTSTSTVYGEAKQIPTPEDYGPLLPISLYGASKLACEALISSYCHTFDMQSWIYRFANIVGPRGSHGVLVDFIRKLRDSPVELEILGSGRQRKSYLEVKECVEAMLLCLEAWEERVNIFNIGSEDSVDVTEIADIVVRQMGLKDVAYRYTGGEEGRGWKGDVRVMLLSLEKIKKLGWRPKGGSYQAIQSAVQALLKEGSG